MIDYLGLIIIASNRININVDCNKSYCLIYFFSYTVLSIECPCVEQLMTCFMSIVTGLIKVPTYYTDILWLEND